jgi:hypothetical protein
MFACKPLSRSVSNRMFSDWPSAPGTRKNARRDAGRRGEALRYRATQPAEATNAGLDVSQISRCMSATGGELKGASE